jgi:hypothetical protein
MDDELLERRLRAALRSEADRLPFTITAPELERQARRRSGSRSPRLTLLLAAALAIGTIGAGAIIAGLADRPAPSPVADASATPASTATPGTGAILPTLDDLMAGDTGTVLAAQAYGPADGSADALPQALNEVLPTVVLGDLAGNGEYAVSVACLGPIPLEVSIVSDAPNQTTDGPRFRCDGSIRQQIIRVDGPAKAFITHRGTVSWRVVVRGDLHLPALPTSGPVPLPSSDGQGLTELIRIEDSTVESDAPEWADDLRFVQVGSVAANTKYWATVWCDAGARMELVFAEPVGASLVPAGRTAITCDGQAQVLALDLPLPNGSPVFVAARPTTRWSVLVNIQTPPVALVNDNPGWQLVGGIGPELHFETTEVSFSDTVGDHGGPLMVVVECAGATQQIDIAVDAKGILGDAFEHYVATCEPGGSRTAITIDTPPTGYIVRQAAPVGTWTALSLLIPLQSPGP